MLSLSLLLSGCSDYKLGNILEGEDTGDVRSEDSGSGISSEGAPEYPIDSVVRDCIALDADACPDNEAEGGGIDAACDSWVSPRRASLDNALALMVNDLNSGVTGIGVYTIFQDNAPSHESGPDVDGVTDSAAMALIAGAEDEIRDAVSEWEASEAFLDDLNAFPLNAIVCRVSVAEYENGDAVVQFIQGHQDAGALSNDISDAVIANAVDAPGAGAAYLSLLPEFGSEDATSYQYAADDPTYDIDRGMDEVMDAADAFMEAAQYFAEVDASVTEQARYATLKYY